ncbi:MAG: hypothetical protein U0163_03860 [Gemmatimonadaceae bacterium]
MSRNERDSDRARDDLAPGPVAAAREAVTGQPGGLPADVSLAAPSVPGAPAPRSRRVSLGRTHCDLSASFRKIDLRKLTKAAANVFGIQVAYAAQDTEKPRRTPPRRAPTPSPRCVQTPSQRARGLCVEAASGIVAR